MDVVLGTMTTLISGFVSYKLGKYRYKGYPLLACLPPVLLNALVVGWELAFFFGPTDGFSWPLYLVMFTEVMVGQAIAVFVFGLPLIKRLEKSALFRGDSDK